MGRACGGEVGGEGGVGERSERNVECFVGFDLGVTTGEDGDGVGLASGAGEEEGAVVVDVVVIGKGGGVVVGGIVQIEAALDGVVEGGGEDIRDGAGVPLELGGAASEGDGGGVIIEDGCSRS